MEKIKTYLTVEDFIENRPTMTTFSNEEIQECIYTTADMLDGLCNGLISRVLNYNLNEDTSQVSTTNLLYRNLYELEAIKIAFIIQTQYTLNLSNDFTIGSSSLSSGGISGSFQRPNSRETFAPQVREQLARARVFTLQEFSTFGTARATLSNKNNKNPYLTKEVADKSYVAQYQPDSSIGSIAMINNNNIVEFANPSSVNFNTIQAQTIWDSTKQSYVPIEQISNNAWIGGTEKNVYTPTETDNKIQEIFDKYYNSILKIIQYNIGQILIFGSDYDYQQFKESYEITDDYFSNVTGSNPSWIYKEVRTPIYKNGVLNPEILIDKADKEYVQQQLENYVTLTTDQQITGIKTFYGLNRLKVSSTSKNGFAVWLEGRHSNNVYVPQNIGWTDNGTLQTKMYNDTNGDFVIDKITAGDLWMSNGVGNIILGTANTGDIQLRSGKDIYLKLDTPNANRVYTNFTTPTNDNDIVTKSYVDFKVDATINLSNYYNKQEIDNQFLAKTGSTNQTVEGTITFQQTPNAPNAVNDLDLMNKQSVNSAITTAINGINLTNYVTTNTNQNISGTKTFISVPNTNNYPTNATGLANKGYVDTAISNVMLNTMNRTNITFNASKYTTEQYTREEYVKLFVKGLKVSDFVVNGKNILDWTRPVTVKSNNRFYTTCNITYIVNANDNTGATDSFEFAFLSIYPWGGSPPQSLTFYSNN